MWRLKAIVFIVVAAILLGLDKVMDSSLGLVRKAMQWLQQTKLGRGFEEGFKDG